MFARIPICSLHVSGVLDAILSRGELDFSIWLCVLGLIVVTAGQKKGMAVDEDEVDMMDTQEKTTRRNPGGGGRCSCRFLENQVDQLELRLDRMVDLWNDFVDKNRNPYDQQQGAYPMPGPVRRPPQGGRQPYMPMPQTPRYGSSNQARNFVEDVQDNGGARRFRF